MLQFWSRPVDRARSVVLVGICLVAAVAALVVGVSDNLPGILLAFAAGAALVLAFVHPWRTQKHFLFLAGGSLFGLVVFAILYGLLEAAARMMAGLSLVHLLLEGLAAAAFLVAFLLCPPAIVVGLVGAAALEIRDRS